MLLVLDPFPGVVFVSCSDDAQQLESQDTDAVHLLLSFLALREGIPRIQYGSCDISGSSVG